MGSSQLPQPLHHQHQQPLQSQPHLQTLLPPPSQPPAVSSQPISGQESPHVMQEFHGSCGLDTSLRKGMMLNNTFFVYLSGYGL